MPIAEQIKKDKLLVELARTNGDVIYGYLPVVRTAPLTYMFDDDRQFLPFQYMNGRETLVAKSSINEVMSIVNVTALEYGNGPYNSLGVSRDDDFEIIKNVYRGLLLRCDPQMYVGDKYPNELRDRLQTVVQHLRAHYSKIRRDKDPTYEQAAS